MTKTHGGMGAGAKNHSRVDGGFEKGKNSVFQKDGDQKSFFEKPPYPTPPFQQGWGNKKGWPWGTQGSKKSGGSGREKRVSTVGLGNFQGERGQKKI